MNGKSIELCSPEHFEIILVTNIDKCKKKNCGIVTKNRYARHICINRIAEEIFSFVEVELILLAILGTGQWSKFLSAK